MPTFSYPLISAEQDADGQVQLTQERFFHLKSQEDVSPQLWHVPISYVTYNPPRSRLPSDKPEAAIMKGSSLTLPQKTVSGMPCRFLKLNLDHVGYYRVQYSADWIERMVGCALQYGPSREGNGWFTNADLAGLLDDSFNLAFAGRYDISVPMQLLSVLHNTTGMRKITV
jgi:aminopeptidase N